MRYWILVLSIFMIFALPPSTGDADTTDENNCGARDTVLSFLSSKYSEKPVAMGLAANGGVIEVLTSRAGSTFTIIVTMPKGQSCMVAAGQGWELLETTTKSQI